MAVSAVVPFPKRLDVKHGWQNQELAELFRVEHILQQAGLSVETDQGVSEEGDPWFIFIRLDTSDVIAHFARIDGDFIAVSLPGNESYRGTTLRDIVAQLLHREQLLTPLTATNTTTLRFHPIVALTAFVTAGLLFAAKEAHADSIQKHDAKVDDGKHAVSRTTLSGGATPSVATTAASAAQNAVSASTQAEIAAQVATALVIAGQDTLSPIMSELTLLSISAETSTVVAVNLAAVVAPLVPQSLDLLQHNTASAAANEVAVQVTPLPIIQPVHVTVSTTVAAMPAVETTDFSSTWHLLAGQFKNLPVSLNTATIQAMLPLASELVAYETTHQPAVTEQKITVQSDPTSYILIEQGKDFSLVDFHLHNQTTDNSAVFVPAPHDIVQTTNVVVSPVSSEPTTTTSENTTPTPPTTLPISPSDQVANSSPLAASPAIVSDVPAVVQAVTAPVSSSPATVLSTTTSDSGHSIATAPVQTTDTATTDTSAAAPSDSSSSPVAAPVTEPVAPVVVQQPVAPAVTPPVTPVANQPATSQPVTSPVAPPAQVSMHVSGTQTVALTSAAETLYFDGGNVTITNFALGIDTLLLSNSVLANQTETVTHESAGDWVIHIGSTSTITMWFQ